MQVSKPNLLTTSTSTPYQKHVKRWGKCELCVLANTRKKVVLIKGVLPCDLLFLGEAPGNSEDVVGLPFVGPAGRLLDEIVNKAIPDGLSLDKAYTNVLACIPKDENGIISTPNSGCIKICSPRVINLINKIAKPKAIVLVGGIANKWYKDYSDSIDIDGLGLEHIHVDHPAYILKADISQRGLLIQKAIVRINDLIESRFLPRK